jgi:hypothetical protein
MDKEKTGLTKIIIESKMNDEQRECLVDEIIRISEIIGIKLEIKQSKEGINL